MGTHGKTRNGPLAALHRGFIDSQEHPRSAGNFDIPLVVTKDDHASSAGAASTDDADVFKSVCSTCIGGENPKRLRSFIAVGRTSALRGFVGPYLGQDSARDRFPYDVIRVIVGRHGSAFAIDDITANLHRRQPPINIALSWTNWRCLSFVDSHEARYSSQVCSDREFLAPGDELVEP